ncbi:MAG: hypothetical protein P8Z75_16065 [Gammaproteobacteria bacterium]
MKQAYLRIIVLLAVSLVSGHQLLAAQAGMQCETGPVKKIYGKTHWLVYSCTDQQTLVIVSEPASPASPFYFTLYRQNGRYHVRGEGSGNSVATDAAYRDLRKLTTSEIEALIRQTKKHADPAR